MALFLKALPQSTGTPSPASVARLIARRSSSPVGSCSWTNFSMRVSSWSASFSKSSVRARRVVPHLGGNVGVLPLLPHLRRPAVGPHLDEVDDPDEVRLRAPGQLEDQRLGVEPVPDHLNRAPEVGAGSVHLVHEADARDA